VRVDSDQEARTGRGLQLALGAALVLAVVVMPFAFAAGANGPQATSSSAVTKQIKRLKRRIAALEAKVNGPAAGDLTGAYPNLQVAPNSLGAAEIVDRSISRFDIGLDSLRSSEINDPVVAAIFEVSDIPGTGSGNSPQVVTSFHETVLTGNIVSETNPAADGITCFELGFTPTFAMASLVITPAVAPDQMISTFRGTTGIGCPTGTDAVVEVWDPTKSGGAGLEGHYFTAAFYR
jgi:hypothetical protein